MGTDIDGWFRGKTFTQDWTSQNFPVWESILAPMRDQPAKLLEIGSYEGRSTVFFLNFMPRSEITCIDIWAPYPYADHWPNIAHDLPNIEARFDANTGAFGKRLTKLKTSSAEALAELILEGRSFDMVYVDGDHRASAALRDCMLSWPLLKAGGVMIIDDYEFDILEDPSQRPKPGVDRFLSQLAANQYSLLHQGYQLVLGKA